MNGLKKVYKKNDSIVARRIADEMILVPIRQNVGDLESIYTLNNVGASVWELIDGKTTVKKIAEAIAVEYEVAFMEAQQDIAEYLSQLESIQAVVGA